VRGDAVPQGQRQPGQGEDRLGGDVLAVTDVPAAVGAQLGAPHHAGGDQIVQRPHRPAGAHPGPQRDLAADGIEDGLARFTEWLVDYRGMRSAEYPRLVDDDRGEGPPGGHCTD
jgi:hypothetical protein